MLAQINDGGLIGRRSIFNGKHIIIGQGVNNIDQKITGIPFFTVSAEIAKFESNLAMAAYGLKLPQGLIESLDASMKMVIAFVPVQLVCIVV